MAQLQYDFSIVGVKAIDRAFASIERRAIQHNLRMSKEFGGVGSGRAGGGAGSAGKQYGPSAAQLYKLDEQQRKRALASEMAAEKAAAREKVRLDKWRQDMRNRHWQEEARNRARAEAAEARASARAMAERRRSAGALFGRIGDSARSTTRAIGATATGALAIGGGFMASAAVGQQMRETAMASQLANQGGRPEIKGQLLKEAQNVRGFTGEEALAGMGAFTDLTGDLDTARAMMKDLAKLSLATGANLDDVAGAAGNFANNLSHIKDPGEKAAAVMEAMRAIAGQGQAGAVELKDLAGGGAVIAAAASQLGGGDQVQNIKKAGVLAQAARGKGGAKSADEALTATMRFTDFMAKNAEKIKADTGVTAVERDKAGNITAAADPRQFIADYLKATGGDLGQINEHFGEMGSRVMKGFRDAYKANGKQGALDEFDRLMKTELKQGDINTRSASRLADPDMQFKETMREFNAQIGSELLPVITKLIPEFAKLLPHVATAARIFGKMIESFADSPLMSIGQMIAAKVALDIATARIGDSVRNALTDSIAGGDGGGAKGGAGLGGAASLGLSLGALTALTIYSSGVVNFEASEVQMDRAGERVTKAREIYAAVESGSLTKEEGKKQIDALFKEQRGDTEKITEGNEATKRTISGMDSLVQGLAGASQFLTGDFAGGGKTLKGAFSGDAEGKGYASYVTETLGMINEGQQKTNESFEASIKQLLVAVTKLSGSADTLNEAGIKLNTAPIATPNRPAAPTI